MTDPYQVLGVQPSATDEEVKAAYRELAKKYHPDHYNDNPLSDLAQEKMQEINEAYDAIIRMRRQGGPAPGRGPFPGGGTSRFMDIRNLIRTGRVMDAETLLDGIPGPSWTGNGISSRGCPVQKKDGSTTPTTIFPLRSDGSGQHGIPAGPQPDGDAAAERRIPDRPSDGGRLQRLRHVQRPDLRGLLL